MPSGRRDRNSRDSTRAFKKARALFKEEGRAANAPCWICKGKHGPIDYDAPAGDPWSHSLDHFYPDSTHPELHDDPANWRHSHLKCNSSRGADPVTKHNSVLPRWW